MPIEPKGTSPISTLCPDNRSHNKEPTPTPSEKTASSMVTTWVSPPSTSLAKLKNDVRNVAPKNQSQEMPSSDRNTVRSVFASFRFFQVSDTGFQLITRPGSDGGAAGMKLAAIRPASAMPSVAPATHAGPA